MQLSIVWIYTKAINPEREDAESYTSMGWLRGRGGKKFDAEAREACGPNIPETFKHTATPAGANWSELLGLRPTPLSCLQTHISESSRTRDRDGHGRTDKGKSEEGTTGLAKYEGRRMLLSATSSEMGVSRGHQLYSLLCSGKKRIYASRLNELP